jgi:chemotaxis protein MotB
MGKKKEPECPKCMPGWIAAFGDLMSLLLCFFVLLLSMSTMDARKVSEAIGSLSGAMSVLEGGIKTEISRKRVQESTPLENRDESSEAVNRVAASIIEASEMVKQSGGPAISLEESEDGFVIRLPANTLFKPGSAKLENEDAILFLKRVAMIIQEFPNNVEVSVRGHTDNTPPGTSSVFRDNWELSSARAISVLKTLIDGGVKDARTHAAGFAEFKPLTTNDSAKGREKNRRVDLHFFSMKPSNESKIKSMLDKADLGK